MNYRKSILLLFVMLVALSVKAQMPADSLNKAKKLRNSGNIEEALKLLKQYHSIYPDDLNTTWVYAQTEFWAKHFNASKALYEEAIKSNPTNDYLKLDYAKMLVDIGDFDKAKPLLNTYLAYDPNNSQALLALAKISFWRGNYKGAGDDVNKVLAKDNTNKNAIELRNEILTAQLPSDTLTKAKQWREQGKLKAALKLLKQFYSNHPNDLNTVWVYAQTEYWAKHLKTSKALYEQAMKTNPANYYLKLDYAKMLVEIGEFVKAKPLLDTYLIYDPDNEQALLALAKISFGQGKYKEAESSVKKVLKKDSTYKSADDLQDEILLAKSPWLKLNAGYYTDDQPLKSIVPSVDAGVYLNPYSSLLFNVQTPVFIGNGKTYNAQWLQVGDQTAFRKIGLVIGVNAGIVNHTNNQESWIGNIELHETLAKHLVISAQAQRQPYYLTLSSLNDDLMVYYYSASIEWNDRNSWNGKAIFLHSQYPDDNYITSLGAWLFTPPLKASVFEFRIGYAYGYSTSKESRFVSQSSVTQVVANYDSTTKIPGIYNPYFTPDDIQVHSALVSIDIHPAKIVDIGLSGSIGFYATAQNPYLYLNKDEAGNDYIATGFSKINFLPASANAFVLVHITKKTSIEADYNYHRGYFYTSNYVGLGVKMNFWNEKK